MTAFSQSGGVIATRTANDTYATRALSAKAGVRSCGELRERGPPGHTLSVGETGQGDQQGSHHCLRTDLMRGSIDLMPGIGYGRDIDCVVRSKGGGLAY